MTSQFWLNSSGPFRSCSLRFTAFFSRLVLPDDVEAGLSPLCASLGVPPRSRSSPPVYGPSRLDRSQQRGGRPTIAQSYDECDHHPCSLVCLEPPPTCYSPVCTTSKMRRLPMCVKQVRAAGNYRRKRFGVTRNDARSILLRERLPLQYPTPRGRLPDNYPSLNRKKNCSHPTTARLRIGLRVL